MHVGSYPLVGATCSGMLGGVELAGCEADTCGDGSDRVCVGPLEPGQNPRSVLLGGGAIPGFGGAAEEDGGLRAGFGGVEDRTEVLEVAGGLVEGCAVSGCERLCGGGTG